MRPPPTRIGNGGRYLRTNASMGPESTSSDTPAISKSLRSNSRYSSAMCGNSSRQGSHHDAQKFTSVTLPRNPASLTVSPLRSGSASAGPNASRVPGAAPSARATSESASNTARTPLASTATAVSRAPRCRVARIAPVAGSSTSTRRRVAAESSEPSAYSRPPRPPPTPPPPRQGAERERDVHQRFPESQVGALGGEELRIGLAPRREQSALRGPGELARGRVFADLIAHQRRVVNRSIRPHRHGPRVHHVVEQRRRRSPDSGESPDRAPQGIEHPDQGCRIGLGGAELGHVVRRAGGGHPARTCGVERRHVRDRKSTRL